MKAKDQRIPHDFLDDYIDFLLTIESDYEEPPQHIFDNIIRNLEIKRGKRRVLKAAIMLFIIIIFVLFAVFFVN